MLLTRRHVLLLHVLPEKHLHLLEIDLRHLLIWLESIQIRPELSQIIQVCLQLSSGLLPIHLILLLRGWVGSCILIYVSIVLLIDCSWVLIALKTAAVFVQILKPTHLHSSLFRVVTVALGLFKFLKGIRFLMIIYLLALYHQFIVYS